MLLYCSRRELAVKAKTTYMGSTINEIYLGKSEDSNIREL